MVTKIVQLGPGMMSQSTQQCHKCGGEGQCIPEGKKCKKCKGQKILKEKEILEICLDKGVPNNHKYTFDGKADE
jgi:DnaJ-class molecular chaperone